MSDPSIYAPAPFWRRLVARTLDLLIAVPLTFLTIIPVLLISFPLAFILSDDQYAQFGAFLCFLTAYTLIEYFLLRRRSGQTIGKGLLGLRVVQTGGGMTPVQPGQQTPSHEQVGAGPALARMAVLIGPAMVWVAVFYAFYNEQADEPAPWVEHVLTVWMLVLLACALAALIDRAKHRGLHDLAARTMVVRAPRRGVNFKQDAMMLLPGRVSLEKAPTATSSPVPSQPTGAPSLRKTL